MSVTGFESLDHLNAVGKWAAADLLEDIADYSTGTDVKKHQVAEQLARRLYLDISGDFSAHFPELSDTQRSEVKEIVEFAAGVVVE